MAIKRLIFQMFGGNTQTSNASHLTVSTTPTAPFCLKPVLLSNKSRKDWGMRTSKPRWTSTLVLPKKLRMKLRTSLRPILVFEIWVPRWVSKQKNRPSEISESLLLSHFRLISRLGKQILVSYRDLYVRSVQRLLL